MAMSDGWLTATKKSRSSKVPVKKSLIPVLKPRMTPCNSFQQKSIKDYFLKKTTSTKKETISKPKNFNVENTSNSKITGGDTEHVINILEQVKQNDQKFNKRFNADNKNEIPMDVPSNKFTIKNENTLQIEQMDEKLKVPQTTNSEITDSKNGLQSVKDTHSANTNNLIIANDAQTQSLQLYTEVLQPFVPLVYDGTQLELESPILKNENNSDSDTHSANTNNLIIANDAQTQSLQLYTEVLQPFVPLVYDGTQLELESPTLKNENDSDSDTHSANTKNLIIANDAQTQSLQLYTEVLQPFVPLVYDGTQLELESPILKNENDSDSQNEIELMELSSSPVHSTCSTLNLEISTQECILQPFIPYDLDPSFTLSSQ